MNTNYRIYTQVQSTPLNQVTLVPEHFDPIKRNLGVDPIKRSELILLFGSVLGQVTRLTGGPSLTGDPIKRSRLLFIMNIQRFIIRELNIKQT